MIKKFKNFDVDEYLENKNAVREAVEDVVDDETPVAEVKEDDVIDGVAIYDNPFILKIANIVGKRLKSAGIGEFGIYHDVVYLNGKPGVWFYGLDDNHKNIVCCRDTNMKTISIFNEFDINGTYTALVTYTTQKLGFKDMLDQLVDDLKQSVSVNEEVINEAGTRYGDGYTADYVRRFETLSTDDKNFVYEFIRNYGKKRAIDEFYDLITGSDPQAVRILKKYVGRDLSSGDGQTRYLMSLADHVVSAASGAIPTTASFKKAIDDGVLDNLVSEYKGAGPAIVTSSGDEFEVADDDATLDLIASREAAKKKAMEEDTKRYEKTLRKLRIMTEAMCHYVKQNGKLDADDQSAMIKRGIFLTGKGGIGKSYTVEQVLEENHMIQGRDYVNISSGSTTAESIFNYLYQYNDKLIIFDDSPDLFSEPKKLAVWKSALQSEGTESLVSYPLQNTKDTTSKLYRTGAITRQDRYFKEMGRKSTTEKIAYEEKRLKELQRELGKDYDKSTAKLMVADEWKELQAETVPLMPDRYVYNGVVIVIGNDTREVLRKTVGEGHWSAIVDRFQDFDLSPMSESVWEVIKKKIMDEYGNSKIPDALCIIPRDLTEEFVEEVDKLIVQPQYKTMTWRVIKAYSKKLRGKYGLEDWKEDLKNDMNTNK